MKLSGKCEPHRRSQPRTVSNGTPACAATRVHGIPAAACSSAVPITSTEHCRRRSIVSGSSTRVVPHDLQTARRGRTRPVNPPARISGRSTPYHQGASTPPHPGTRHCS